MLFQPTDTYRLWARHLHDSLNVSSGSFPWINDGKPQESHGESILFLPLLDALSLGLHMKIWVYTFQIHIVGFHGYIYIYMYFIYYILYIIYTHITIYYKCLTVDKI